MSEVKQIILKYVSLRNYKATARHFNISKNTVKGYIRRLHELDIDMSQISSMSESELELAVYKGSTHSDQERQVRFASQVDYFLKELRRKGVTKQLLWEEYKEKDPEGYTYSHFCAALKSHTQSRGLTLRMHHKPGEVLMVDYAGKKIPYVDEHTGEYREAEVLVAVLPHSQMTYVIALPSQRTEDFIYGITKALEYYGGSPRYIMSDNLKAYVTKADRYEPTYNQLSVQMSEHYSMDMQATRVAKPKDKGSVENMVRTVYTRLYAPLRDMTFHSIDQINVAFSPLLEAHNDTPFQKRQGSRSLIFEESEKHILTPLPSDRFEIKKSTVAKVQRNYHILLGEDKNYYSVPYKYVGKKARIIYTATTVEIYHKTQRIAIHRRADKKQQYSYITEDNHKPSSHKLYEKMSQSQDAEFIKQAEEIGQNTMWAITHILTHQPNQDQAQKSCLGILRLGQKYDSQRLENACLRCKQVSKVNYTLLCNILSKNLDQESKPDTSNTPAVLHQNIRGSQCYK